MAGLIFIIIYSLLFYYSLFTKLILFFILIMENQANQYFERLNQVLINNFAAELGTILANIESQALNLEQLLRFVLVVRDEARFIRPEDCRYAYCVSQLLKNNIYPLTVNSIGDTKWKKLWEQIEFKEYSNPLPNQAIVARGMGITDTSSKLLAVIIPKENGKNNNN